MSVDGDEIVLAAGTYTPADTVTVAKGVTIRSASGVPESVIVTGAGARRPFILNHADAKLLSITVQNGKSDGASYTVGSNIRINANGGTVSNCVVRGGIFSTYATRGNGGGAGISCASENGLIVSCVVTNNEVQGNSGIQQGGGLYLTAGKAVNCFIAENKAAVLGSNSSSFGGGVFMNGTAKLVNCTVVDNTGPNCGGVDAYGANVQIVNCLIWGNSGDGASDVCIGHTECFDNCVARYPINANCFDPGTSATTGPYYTPTPAFAGIDNSKAVEGVTLPAADILGNPRVAGAAADVGCVEYQATAPDVAFSVSESSGFAPFTVTFTAHTSGMSGIASYNWDFDGDGAVDETTTAPGVTHTYSVGYATPMLTVTYSGQDYTYSVPANAIKSFPRTMFVDGKSANPVEPYGTKATAAKTIAAALSAAVDGQEIVVMTNGSPYVITAALQITKAVTLRGETGNPEDVVVARTSGMTKLTRIANAGAFVHSMVFHGGSDTAYGTGIRIEPAGGTVSNCVIRGCIVNGYWSSAAVYAAGTDALVTHCVITNNTTATGSSGDQKTAGLHLAGGAAAVNCLVANNRERATSGTCCTGGAYVQNGYLYNCTVVDNTARRCGGIRIAAGGAYNCVIAGNTATYSGSDYNNLYDSTQKSYCHYCACNDADAFNETCQQGTAASFFSNYAGADYTVGTGSRLIDNGTSDGIVMEGTDLAGGARVIGQAIDIGCYEFDTSAFTGGLSADVTQGIVPITVNFTASASGTNGTDQLRFKWDFDGDGAYDETTDVPTVSHVYTKGGNYTVDLKIENVTSTKETVVAKPGMLYFCAPTMFVVSGANPAAKFPYDSWETASTSVKTAVDAALDGVEIILSNGTHNVTAQIDVTKALDIHGLSGAPADTIVLRTGGSSTEPGCKLNNAAAKVRDITWDGGAVNRPGWHLEQGGMITNCVLRRFKNYDYWAGAGAVIISGNGLVTHCVITNNTQTNLGDSGKAIVKVYSGRIENSLIAYNTDSAGVPIAVVADKMLNCTVVANEIKSGTLHLRSTGAITNSIVMCNTVGGAAGTVMSIQAGKSGHNIADAAAEGFACDAAANVFDKSARVLPWTISLEAARMYRGDKTVASPEVDLAGNLRRIRGRLDPGCHQCQGVIGFSFIIR